MGAKLRSTFKFVVEDPDGGDIGWGFTATIPNSETLTRLEELLHADSDNIQQKMLKAAVGNPKIMDRLKSVDKNTTPEDIMSDGDLVGELIAAAGPEMMLDSSNPSFTVQFEAACLMQDNVGQIEGLTQDDSSDPLTWDDMKTSDAPYYCQVLCGVAEEVLDRVRGRKGQAKIKNLNRSSP